ncbi:MAG: hypothetical protein WCK02_09740 [Bacteroidota bacterium]
MGLNIQYITDTSGHKNAVLLPMRDWVKIQKDLDCLEKLKNKKNFFDGLVNAFNELSLIKEGKKKPNSFDDLLNEL